MKPITKIFSLFIFLLLKKRQTAISLLLMWKWFICYTVWFCFVCFVFVTSVNRGSYMRAHFLLNLLNKLGKSDKMRGLPSILSLFCNKFYKFNNTRARMLDSIYHMTLRLLWNLISAVKMLKFCHYVRNIVMDVIMFLKICKPLVFYRF